MAEAPYQDTNTGDSYKSIGVPGYLIGTDTFTPATTIEPQYGVADSNGYVGVTADYNSHANGTDRPTSSSVKAEFSAAAAEADVTELPDTAHYTSATTVSVPAGVTAAAEAESVTDTSVPSLTPPAPLVPPKS